MEIRVTNTDCTFILKSGKGTRLFSLPISHLEGFREHITAVIEVDELDGMCYSDERIDSYYYNGRFGIFEQEDGISLEITKAELLIEISKLSI